MVSSKATKRLIRVVLLRQTNKQMLLYYAITQFSHMLHNTNAVSAAASGAD